ncbi:hypothetical protein DF141_11210 [Burkholderia cenocepacia]|nr:hypothetical protein DF141_11210 [Burkholderia cenocepacia]RQZ96377.1 hypothetical protein DF058_10725 [Burkholderia cenocepacia]RRA16604.1 hypothetical protein DF059_10850 [Burkholderia cenocepacia]
MHRAERVAPACRYLGPSHLDVSVVASAWSLRKTPRKYCPSAIAFESRTSWANRAAQSACPSDRGRTFSGRSKVAGYLPAQRAARGLGICFTCTAVLVWSNSGRLTIQYRRRAPCDVSSRRRKR